MAAASAECSTKPAAASSASETRVAITVEELRKPCHQTVELRLAADVDLDHLPVLDRLAVQRRRLITPVLRVRHQLAVVHRMHGLPDRDRLDAPLLVADD